MRSQEKLHPVPEGRNRKEEETNARMRTLWTILIVLVIALIAAVIYEIGLGNGLQQTGSERMEEIGRELVAETESQNETRFMTESETEPGTDSSAGAASETDSSVGAASETDAAVDSDSETGSSAGTDSGAEPETQEKADPQKEIERIQNSRQSEGSAGEDAAEDAPTLAGVGGL